VQHRAQISRRGQVVCDGPLHEVDVVIEKQNLVAERDLELAGAQPELRPVAQLEVSIGQHSRPLAEVSLNGEVEVFMALPAFAWGKDIPLLLGGSLKAEAFPRAENPDDSNALSDN